MPLGYGGGVNSLDDAKRLFEIGCEKVIVNSAAIERPRLISELSDFFGSQAIVVSIDVKSNWLGKNTVWTKSGSFNTKLDPIIWANKVQELGAGEIFVTSIDNEGTWLGLDTNLVEKIVKEVSIPVIAHGGVGSVGDINEIIETAGPSAVGVGSLVVFQKKDMGVLVNFPDRKNLSEAFVQ